MKVVWICHFTNNEINSILPLYRKVNEFAPWIPNMIKEIEKRNDIDLHVIAPHFFIKKATKINLRGVTYYFLPTGIPVWHRYYPDYLPIDILTGYCLFNKRVKNIVNKLKPDVVNLIGAENAYYSTSIFELKTYPIIITIQGFISQYPLKKFSIRTRYRVRVEQKILKEFRHFIGEGDSKNHIQNFNNSFSFFKAYFPTNEELIKEINEKCNEKNKQYDIINFGRLDVFKGVYDFIKVVAEIKKIKPDFRAAITGIGDFEDLINFAKQSECEANIEFIPFKPNQEELFRLVKKSKIFVVPTYNDRLPSAIRESMLLKVPVIAYKTGGIPLLNCNKENLKLVETGDYRKLADEIIKLLENESERENLTLNAYEFAKEEFSLKHNIDIMLEAYKTTIEDYKK